MGCRVGFRQPQKVFSHRQAVREVFHVGVMAQRHQIS
jgi:hypothetical protein